MRFDKIRNRQSKAEFQIAPLIDCVFLLLLFFICAGEIKRMEAELSINIPTISKRPQDRVDSPLQEVIIKVKRNRVFELQGSGELPLTGEGSIRNKLLRLKESAPDQLVIIQGDTEALHDDIVKVLDVCSEIGLKKVSIALME